MKTLFKILSFLVTLSLVFSLFTISSTAASSATLYFNKNSIEVGKEVTVSVSINPNIEMYAVAFNLEYDDSVLEYKEGNGVGNAGVIKVVESPTGSKSVKYNLTFKAIKAGSCTFSVTDCTYDILGDNNSATTKKFGGASATMTVKDPSLSSDAKLKSLKVTGFSLSPSFSSTTTSYKITVPYETKKINVSATPSDSAAKVKSVSGNTNLKVGKNTVTVSVEAPNGTLKKYTITVTRSKKEEKEETDDTSSDDSESEIIDESPLETTVEGSLFTIAQTIPQEILFDGFSIEVSKVNGYDIETAVDADKNYKIFYLKSQDSEDLTPYLYDEALDTFEKLKYGSFNNKNYIFAQIPNDFDYSGTMTLSNQNIGEFSVQCLNYTSSNISEFYYVYCFVDGEFSWYRYDVLEKSLQRFPEFQPSTTTQVQPKDNIFTRFASLSTNGKVIIIALFIALLGVFSLLILIIFYFVKKAVSRPENIYFTEDVFDEIEVKKDDAPLE